MYESFFGLSRRPFHATPDPECFFASPSLTIAVRDLQLRLGRGQGIGVIVGPSGVGKTVLARRVASDLATELTPLFIAHAGFSSRRALFQTLLFELGTQYNGLDEQELRLQFIQQLRDRQQASRPVLLVFDEAHQLETSLFEETRTIADLTHDGEPLVRLLLCGQPELEDRLAEPSLKSLNDRIACQILLEPLSSSESRGYVEFRVQQAGGDVTEVFSDEALARISRVSSGLPRCLNQLCDHALLLSYLAAQKPVTLGTVNEALHDLRNLPLPWTLDSVGDGSNTLTTSADDEPTGDFTDDPYPDAVNGEPLAASHSSQPADESASLSAAVPLASFEFGADEPEGAFATESGMIDESIRGELPYAPRLSEQFTAQWPEQPMDQRTDSNSENAQPQSEERGMSFPENAQGSMVMSPMAGIVPLGSGGRRSTFHLAEEAVVDRYSQIDAGNVADADASPIGPRQPSARTRKSAPMILDDALPRDSSRTDAVRTINAVPPKAIGSAANDLESSIEVVHQPSHSTSESTVVSMGRCANASEHERDRMLTVAEVGAVALRSEEGASIPLMRRALEEAMRVNDGDEGALGMQVLDLCLDARHAVRGDVATEMRESIERGSHPVAERDIPLVVPDVVEEPRIASRYDAVEPEPERKAEPIGSRTDESASRGQRYYADAGTPADVVPPPNFKTLFSVLRKKAGRAASKWFR